MGGGIYPLLTRRGLQVGSVLTRAYIHGTVLGVQQRNPYYPKRRTPRGRALKREKLSVGGGCKGMSVRVEVGLSRGYKLEYYLAIAPRDPSERVAPARAPRGA